MLGVEYLSLTILDKTHTCISTSLYIDTHIDIDIYECKVNMSFSIDTKVNAFQAYLRYLIL